MSKLRSKLYAITDKTGDCTMDSEMLDQCEKIFRDFTLQLIDWATDIDRDKVEKELNCSSSEDVFNHFNNSVYE